MAKAQTIKRRWFVRLAPEEAHIRCLYQRVGKQVLRFTVQLEINHHGAWLGVVRYDNAHGFCHRDTLHPDGTPDKTGVFVGNVNDTFTYAIEELKANWEEHRARYLREMEP